MPQPQLLAPIEEKILMSRVWDIRLQRKAGRYFLKYLIFLLQKLKLRTKKNTLNKLECFNFW